MPEWIADTPWWIFVGIVGVLAALGRFIFKMGKWVERVDSSLTTFKETVTKIQEDMKDAVSEIREDIKKILQWMPSKTIDSDSPLKPTQLGLKVSESIDAPLIVKDLVPSLRARADGKHPYDIQEICFDFIRDEYKPNDEVEKKIKQCAYDNGIDRADVMDVLAVGLRDEIIRLIEDNT